MSCFATKHKSNIVTFVQGKVKKNSFAPKGRKQSETKCQHSGSGTRSTLVFTIIIVITFFNDVDVDVDEIKMALLEIQNLP